jgi:hypothetical protein
LGQQTQQVSVSAARLQVETISTQMGEVVTGTSITAVPLNGRSYTDRVARGWILTGITRFANGIPVTLSDSGDRSLLGTANAGAGSAVDRPNCALGGNLARAANDPRTGLIYFNTAMFSRETIGQIGTCDTRMFHGPGTNNFDMALLKDMHITEAKFVQFRFELFNAFNHAQFNNPSGSVTNANFGRVTSARSARAGQFALEFVF